MAARHATTRLSRDESKARTREDLIEAAIRVFARRGFHGATVDDVAAEAGYTTGAVYSNFAGKEDLFMAGFEHEVARHIAEVSAAVADAGEPAARSEAAARQWMEFLAANPDRFLLFLEYMAYALRDERLRGDFKARFGAFRAATARMLADARQPLPLPAERMAVIANALTYGIAIERLAEPGAVPDELFGEALGLLLGGGR